MRILLIDILRTTLEEVWPSVEHSLGLMYIASSLKKQFGNRVTIRIWTLISKPNQHDDERRKTREILEEWQPDMVGIRCLTIGKDSMFVLAETVKDWNSDCFLVAGGPYPTDDPEEPIKSGTIDFVVIGEGELTANDLVGRLLERAPVTDIPGIAYLCDGKVVRNGPRLLNLDLDSLPFPDYSLVDLDEFSNQYLTFSSKIYQPHGNILTTRGCAYRCMYCHHILGKKFRARSPENVLAEIRFLHDRYGITDFQIIDDIFNFNPNRAKAICDLIIKSGMNLTFSFPNGVRGDMMDEELIDKMAEAGTKFISYAVETASPRLQKLIRKNLKLDRVFRAIEYTAKVGVISRGFFMLGFPTETEEEALQTIEFAKASALCGATYFTVVYFPGTELYRLARSLGYFKEDGYSVQRDYVQVGEGPYDFSLERLVHLKKKAIQEFAFTKERIDNALRVLPNYFTQREIDGFFMAYVVSSQMMLDEVRDEVARKHLRRYFIVAERFSRAKEFYV
ncbi:MAG: radical SAM protein [Deltaproteobacteria bacterium]|nr:radical SAM protein [Deltaproteobacteria bacterium]NIS77095.1 radical SAM protein [Deltaproteobacteria bacterium]